MQVPQTVPILASWNVCTICQSLPLKLLEVADLKTAILTFNKQAVAATCVAAEACFVISRGDTTKKRQQLQ